MKNSKNKIKLHLFLNIFDVTPTFLVPVFTDGVGFFFQEIENDAIKSFSEADMDYFSVCPQIKPMSNDIHSVGESAIYAVQFPDGKFISGNSRTLLAHLNEEKALIDEFPVFKENVQEFQKQINKKEFLTISSQQQITEKEIKRELLNTLREIIDIKRNSIEDNYAQFSVLHTSLCENQIKHIRPYCCFGKYPNALNSLSLVPYTSKIFSKNSNIFIKNMIYENDSCAVYYQGENEVMANSIFQFYDFIMTQRSSANGINPMIKYEKENSISVEQQLKVIDILLHCIPLSHITISRLIKDWNESFGRQSNEKINKMQSRLWTYNHLYTLFSLINFSISWLSLRALIHDWKLCIQIPGQITSDEDSSLSTSDWLCDYLETQNDDNAFNENRVFWLEIKQFSSHIYAIIAQSDTTKDAHFLFKREPISDVVLSSFIEGLYNDIGAKVYLLLTSSLCNRTPLNENFSKWLLRNENICNLIENPMTLTVRE